MNRITRPVTIKIEPNYILSSPDLVRVEARWIDKNGVGKSMASVMSADISMDQLLWIVQTIVKESQE